MEVVVAEDDIDSDVFGIKDSLPPGGVVRRVSGLNLDGDAYREAHLRDK
jgi:hypothetical protein